MSDRPDREYMAAAVVSCYLEEFFAKGTADDCHVSINAQSLVEGFSYGYWHEQATMAINGGYVDAYDRSDRPITSTSEEPISEFDDRLPSAQLRPTAKGMYYVLGPR